VLIGPNGSGKANVVEAVEILRSTPTKLATAIRNGGGASEWLWKGSNQAESATLIGRIGSGAPYWLSPPLRYRLEFGSVASRGV
jgi:predicted ATPase